MVSPKTICWLPSERSLPIGLLGIYLNRILHNYHECIFITVSTILYSSPKHGVIKVSYKDQSISVLLYHWVNFNQTLKKCFRNDPLQKTKTNLIRQKRGHQGVWLNAVTKSSKVFFSETSS